MKYLKLLRPLHWIKNILIFAPIFFAAEFNNITKLKAALIAFVIFSITASCMYIVNDIADRDKDAKHPIKKKRPLAAGTISVAQAMTMLILLIIIASVLMVWSTPQIIWLIALYICLNILYSMYLKHVVILDVLLLSVFYLLRVLVGGSAADVYISPWIVLCIIFLTLFVGFAKRKAECKRVSKRPVLKFYGSELLDKLLVITAALAICSYGLYSVLGLRTSWGIYSILIVVFVFFRYFYILKEKVLLAEFPEKIIFKDNPTLVASIIWIIFMFFVFYVS